ncbi:DUF951 domain-containing protein [Peptoniphilus sp. KCTC 25270]|uniref:DUF951 domain-containing protein n=1 Tax=Peptoniphilus sp. KCTC 25270 TaxID=2897414 RepID=UPI001E6041E9|nr:DUF951 domain-containing protein [Peptoniphilus sp. KCTC 25270]MCD1146686.1 DUF951 domain-containing protein [Peptoniphilus sp. KCTC 25270]
MTNRLYYELNDLVTLKKGHPCGENEWKILRKGADIKLECQGCQHIIWMTRMEFEKRVRKILVDGKWISIVHHHPEELD